MKLTVEFELDKMPRIELLTLRGLLERMGEKSAADACLKVYMKVDKLPGVQGKIEGALGKVGVDSF